MTHEIRFAATIVRFDGQGGWHAVFLPAEQADEARFFAGHRANALGAIPVKARIGNTTWTTSLFPDAKKASFMLPIKAEVRRVENLKEGDRADILLTVG